MKILNKYHGKVNKINPEPEPSMVTLKDINTGNIIETTAETKKLLEQGINNGDEFEITIQELFDGTTSGVINKLNSITEYRINYGEDI